MDFAVEPLVRCWDEVMGLAQQHWQETEAYRHGQGFRPDRARYEHYARLGCFFVATARLDGVVKGYCGMYVMPSMHTGQCIATEDTWFLAPDARKGRNALSFFKFIEQECRNRGAVEVTVSSKLNKTGPILKYMGYQEVSTQWSKNLLENRNVRSVASSAA